MLDVIASVSGTIEKRRSKAEETYLRILAATHAGTRPTSGDIADALAEAVVSLDQFERDLTILASRDQQRELLATSIEQAAAVTPASEAVAALQAERQRWNLEFRDRLGAAVGAEQEARSGAERVPQIRQRLIETSKNPALRAKHDALHAEFDANKARIEAMNHDLRIGVENEVRFSSMLAHKRYNGPAQKAEWESFVADWPEAKKRLEDEIDALEDRQQAIPVEVEALTPQFIDSVL